MSTDSIATKSAPEQKSSGGQTRSKILSALSPRRISGVYLWIVLIVFFALANENFFTTTTLRSVASEQAVTAIVAVGLMIALAAGVFDLSIAGTMGIANIIVAKLMAGGMAVPEAIILTLLMCSVIGIVNGILVVGVRIDPFIATLGTNSILAAMIVLISNNQNVLGVPESFASLSTDKIATIPLPVFYVIGLSLAIWYVLEWTPIGRRLYATGGGRQVANLAGIRTNAYVICSFIASATIAAAAGILVVASVGTGSTEVGPSYLLPAFAAGFLGATQFRPGRYNVWGTVLAVYLLATGVKGLVLMGAAVWVPEMFNGLALLVAVGAGGFQRWVRIRRDKEAVAEAVEDPKAAPA